jgi:hypothetical protein
VEDDRIEHQHERQEEVRLNRDGVEVGHHRDASEHDLADDSSHEAGRQPGQIPSPRLTDERPRDGSDDDQRDEAGDRPVHELDGRVVAARLEQLGSETAFLARRPLRAAEPGAGDPHRSPGGDDRHEEQHRSECDPRVGARRQA